MAKSKAVEENPTVLAMVEQIKTTQGAATALTNAITAYRSRLMASRKMLENLKGAIGVQATSRYDSGHTLYHDLIDGEIATIDALLAK